MCNVSRAFRMWKERRACRQRPQIGRVVLPPSGSGDLAHERGRARHLVGKGSQPIPWETPSGDATEWVAAFRPSDVRIARSGDGLHGVIRRANFLGAMMDYLIEIDGAHLRTSIETHHAIAQDLMFKAGDECSLSFLSLHWFEKESLKGVLEE